jgi:tRNA modification GTPase
VLIDTAGVAEAPPIPGPPLPADLAQAAQQATGRESAAADLVLLCLDSTRTLEPWEKEQLLALDQRHIVVWTKSDLQSHLNGGPDGPAGPDLHADPNPALRVSSITTSSRTGAGLVELKRAISAALQPASSEGGVIAATSDRCRESLRLADEALVRALAVARASQGDELIAAELRLALDDIGRVIGAVYTDDILDRVFSRFCIGK